MWEVGVFFLCRLISFFDDSLKKCMAQTVFFLFGVRMLMFIMLQFEESSKRFVGNKNWFRKTCVDSFFVCRNDKHILMWHRKKAAITKVEIKSRVQRELFLSVINRQDSSKLMTIYHDSYQVTGKNVVCVTEWNVVQTTAWFPWLQ
jgi:hypothetical protein